MTSANTRCWEGVCFVPPEGWSVRAEAPHKLVYASPDFSPAPRSMGPEVPKTGYLLEIGYSSPTNEQASLTPTAFVDNLVERLRNMPPAACEPFEIKKVTLEGQPFVFEICGRDTRMFGLYGDRILNIIETYGASATGSADIFSSFISTATFQNK